MKLLVISRFLVGALLTIGPIVGCSRPPASSPLAPNVLISTDYVYYAITGSTTDELRAQMDRLGPTDAQGNRFDAYADWHANWSYPFSIVDGQCTTGPIQVNLQMIFTLPQWTPSTGVSQDLVDQWQVYLAALRRHEDGHKQIATAAGYAIYQALSPYFAPFQLNREQRTRALEA